MSKTRVKALADELEAEAARIILSNTYPPEAWRNNGPDLVPEKARHAADLFACAAGLRAMKKDN